MTRIVLLRHGKAADAWNDYDRLSDLGLAQAAKAGERLAAEEHELTLGFHGTLRRQRQTAEAVASAFAASGRALSWHELPGLDELSHQVVEAAARQAPELSGALREALPPWLAGQSPSTPAIRAFMMEAFLRYAEGAVHGDFEPFSQFRARVETTLRHLAQQGGTVLAVSSGGVIATMLGLALRAEAGPALRTMALLQNTSLSELWYSTRHDRYTLARVNDVHHLSEAQRTLL